MNNRCWTLIDRNTNNSVISRIRQGILSILIGLIILAGLIMGYQLIEELDVGNVHFVVLLTSLVFLVFGITKLYFVYIESDNKSSDLYIKSFAWEAVVHFFDPETGKHYAKFRDGQTKFPNFPSVEPDSVIWSEVHYFVTLYLGDGIYTPEPVRLRYQVNADFWGQVNAGDRITVHYDSLGRAYALST